MDIESTPLNNFYGYMNVMNSHVLNMEEVINNPDMPISLYVDYKPDREPPIPKLHNLNAFLINGNLPPKLNDLYCNNNLIEELPPLSQLEELEVLTVNSNLITTLPALPNSLQNLYCDNNHLTSLPEILPSDLYALSCSHNQISSLPQINELDDLIYLECSDNLLTHLPALPNNVLGLLTLICSNNPFTQPLPELPRNLGQLICINNNLNTLPRLTIPLKILNCKNNPLSQGLPELTPNLLELNCSYCQLFVLPSLPPKLLKLNCYNNHLNDFPTLPPNLIEFNISNNPLIGNILNRPLPDFLTRFNCSNCQITSLPSKIPFNLKKFNCANNDISKLPKILPNLIEFNCSNNKLTKLPDLPDSLRVLFCRGNNFDDISINKIIAFYKKAIANGFPETNPTFQEELDYFQINRSKTFINAFGQFPQGEKGQTVSIGPGITAKPKSIPGKAMENILEYSSLPLPSGNLGGTRKKRRNFFKKKTKTFKNKKPFLRRKKNTLKKRFK